MNTPAKLGAYALGLAVVFGATFGVGTAVGGVGTPPVAKKHTAHGETGAAGHSGGSDSGGSPTPSAQATPAGASIPGGLQVSQNGYTLTPLTTTVEPGTSVDFRFTVTGPDGKPVTGYQVQHDKKLHFILVSRDLAHFQHLHPVEAGDGVWSVPLTLPSAGAYRMFADFAPEGGKGMTLGADLYAAGEYAPKALPSAGRTATVDGYTVTLDGDLVPGRASRVTLTISKDGKPVTDLQPYLGAYGHLVALRGGDLAYLHVHPDGEPGDGETRPGPEIVFYAEVPSRGDYRFFLDFQHDGEVRTTDFTVHANDAPASGERPGGHSGDHDESQSGSGGHGEHTH
ncbi:hypothetical protein [Microtetraspora sp. NBRC 16547]|uniref:hypothetical protein n=1 Tax=Microtetraspora sp. NBRC 16547 TaxID=3030993 RepID=UPI002557BA2D|nr:hypothetical protein [Microtetraspora sp. NBRC 16547]